MSTRLTQSTPAFIVATVGMLVGAAACSTPRGATQERAPQKGRGILSASSRADGDRAAEAENALGLRAHSEKKLPQAISHFRKALYQRNLSDPLKNSILLNLATSQSSLNLLAEAKDSLGHVSLEKLETAYKANYYFLKANLFLKSAMPEEACRTLLQASILVDSTFQQRRGLLYQTLEQALNTVGRGAPIEKLLSEFEMAPAADALLYKLGSLEASNGNRPGAEFHFRRLVSQFPQSKYYAEASGQLKAMRPVEILESRSIGVLLPLSGKFAKFGQKTLQGIQLALGIFDPSEPDSKIEIIAEDCGDDPVQAVEALNRLAYKHHVVGVIGPILTKGFEQVTQRAQDIGIPLISLARKSTPPLDMVFHAGLTPQLQMQELARVAIQKLGFKNFAIAYPNEKYGIELSHAFWDAIEDHGGQIVGFEGYPPNETDFRHVVDKLSGLHLPETRKRELELLAQEREANKITKRTRKTEQYYRLSPIVDYDAVFIPDDPKTSSQLFPTFAYRDVDHIKFLGTSTWNTSDFLDHSERYGESAVFLDAFSPTSKLPAQEGFAKAFKKTFSQDPSSFECLAFDAASILREALVKAGSNASRPELRDQLKNIQNFPGLTGPISFKDGTFHRPLLVLSVHNGQFTELE